MRPRLAFLLGATLSFLVAATLMIWPAVFAPAQAASRGGALGKIVQIIGPFEQCANGLCGETYYNGEEQENAYLRILALNDRGEWFISDPINQGATTLYSVSPHMNWYRVTDVLMN
jgi:hypothetical protein